MRNLAIIIALFFNTFLSGQEASFTKVLKKLQTYKKTFKIVYKMAEAEGNWTLMNASGTMPLVESRYIASTNKVRVTYFQANGQPALMGKLNELGALEGSFSLHHPNGKTFLIASMENGKMEGEVQFYYASQRPLALGNFQNGLMHGPWSFYYENGNPEAVGYYLAGNQAGKWSYFYSDGSNKEEVNYEIETNYSAPQEPQSENKGNLDWSKFDNKKNKKSTKSYQVNLPSSKDKWNGGLTENGKIY